MSDLKLVPVKGQTNVFTKALIFHTDASAAKMWIWDKATPIYVYFDNSERTWTATEKSAFMAAVKSWEAVSGLRFAVTSVKSKADFIEHKVGNAELGAETLGEHGSPEMAALEGFDGALRLGGGGQAHGYFNADDPNWTKGLKAGGLSFNTIIHETGHALNLAHPHDTGGGSGLFPGVTEDDASDLGSFNLTHNLYSIMSYNGSYTFAGGKIVFGTDTSPPSGFSHTVNPGPFDIAAVQAMYGARAAATGNNTYALGDTAGPWLTIWDTGGTDSITYAGARKAYIDLTPASLKVAADGGGGLSYVANVYKGFSIAPGVIIEKATGGSGADTITGNAVANVLSGRGGNDVITGAGGADTMSGGSGTDRFDYNALTDTGKTEATCDFITDFTHGTDDIDLFTIDANGTRSGNGKFIFLVTEAADFTGRAGDLHWYKTESTTIVEGDVNGDRKLDFQIELAGLKTLSAGDFIL